MEFLSSSPAHTQKIAALLALEIKKTKNQPGSAFVVGLYGGLGAGKTTFIQGFARGLGMKRNLPSPTFLIVRNYKLKAANYKFLYHVDAYRLEHPKELRALGFGEILKEPKNMVIIEWADKIKRLLPEKMIWIGFEHGKDENKRVMKISTGKK
jgi:tRNA threonylcarbamoyladenosine biosynthesis protein TsaE